MTRHIAGALAAATLRLRAAGVDTPERDARRLLAHAAGIAPDRLTLHLRDSFEEGPALESALVARESRQPVSQIIGQRLFYGRPFRVTPHVLDPRPETEELVAVALELPFDRVLDLGTGSGCILLTLLAERPGAIGLGADLSPEALEVARGNARETAPQAHFVCSDWFASIVGCFDLIVSNPPYISAAEMDSLDAEPRLWEPRMALTDGGDGLGAYRAIAAQAPAHLVPDGRLLVEIGPSQGPAVAALFSDAGFESVELRADMDGRDRVVMGRAGSG